MKKQNNNLILGIIIIIAIFALLVYGGDKGWFKSSSSIINNIQTPTPSTIQNQYSSYTVNLAFDKSDVCLGTDVTGTINSNIPNGVCSLFTSVAGGQWQFLQTYYLNAQGSTSDSNKMNTIGSAQFQVICCDSSNNCKLSNKVSLTVNACGLNEPTCTDSDNGKDFYTPGHTTNSLGNMYDTCQPNGMDLLEFYCENGVQKSTGIGCISGCTQVVNGGYCNQLSTPTCTDSDGGQDDQFNIFGTCEDSQTQTGHQDTCTSGTRLTEWFCNSHSLCESTQIVCPNGWICLGGKCAQPRCQDIIMPTSQASCDVGYCGNGDGCDFVEATLHSVARCECVT